MRLLLTLVCAAWVIGCCPSQALTTGNLERGAAGAESVPASDLEGQLRAVAGGWQGTPHAEGGADRSGIDASALVRNIASEVLGVSLPRSTARQFGIGEEIRREDLAPGDLIFFRPTNQPRHVGMYLSSGEFVHSWPDDGVVVASLEDPFWNGAYWAARRLVSSGSVVSQPAAEEEVRRPVRRRVGW